MIASKLLLESLTFALCRISFAGFDVVAREVIIMTLDIMYCRRATLLSSNYYLLKPRGYSLEADSYLPFFDPLVVVQNRLHIINRAYYKNVHVKEIGPENLYYVSFIIIILHIKYIRIIFSFFLLFDN